MNKNYIFYFILLLLLGGFLWIAANPAPVATENAVVSANLRPKSMQGEIHRLDLLKQQLESPVSYRENLHLEVVTYKPELVYPGKILLPVQKTQEVYLVDHELNVLHTWPVDAERAELLPSCNLGVIFGTRWGRSREPWKKIQGIFAELNWDGSLAWYYQAEDILHHDFQLLPDDSYLLVRHEFLNQNIRPVKFRKPNYWAGITADSVIRVNRAGEDVWQWNTWENLDINSCGSNPHCELGKTVALAKGKKKRNDDWSHINTISLIPENKWYQAGEKEFKPGNLLVLPRNFWEINIIDYHTNKVVWKYSGTEGDPLITGHEAVMIEEGLPGAGNILVLDNGNGERPYSIVREINPITKEQVWSYQDQGSFYAPTGGLVQRLPNGNTFISADNGGRVLEVTSTGEVAWDIHSSQRVYRAHKYAEGYCPNLREL